MLNNILVSSADAGAGVLLGIIGAFYVAVLGLYCLFFLASIITLIIWLWLLIDCVQRENYDGPNDKLLWVIIIFFGGLIGAVLYYFMIKTKKDPPKIVKP